MADTIWTPPPGTRWMLVEISDGAGHKVIEASCQQGEPCGDPALCPDPLGCDLRPNSEKDTPVKDPCPECGAELQPGDYGSGVKCGCGYWFCY